jgi:hypothetical protein
MRLSEVSFHPKEAAGIADAQNGESSEVAADRRGMSTTEINQCIRLATFETIVREFVADEYPQLDAFAECRPYLLINEGVDEIYQAPLAPLTTKESRSECLSSLMGWLKVAGPVDTFAVVWTEKTPIWNLVYYQLIDVVGGRPRKFDFVTLGPGGPDRDLDPDAGEDLIDDYCWMEGALTLVEASGSPWREAREDGRNRS